MFLKFSVHIYQLEKIIFGSKKLEKTDKKMFKWFLKFYELTDQVKNSFLMKNVFLNSEYF